MCRSFLVHFSVFFFLVFFVLPLTNRCCRAPLTHSLACTRNLHQLLGVVVLVVLLSSRVFRFRISVTSVGVHFVCCHNARDFHRERTYFCVRRNKLTILLEKYSAENISETIEHGHLADKHSKYVSQFRQRSDTKLQKNKKKKKHTKSET